MSRLGAGALRSFLLVILAILILLAAGLFLWTRIQTSAMNTRYSPSGSTIEIGGRDIHFVDVKGSGAASLPPILFIHGASGNLLDQVGAYREKLAGQARLIFVDRPGHGFSERGLEKDNNLAGHAASYAGLLDELGIKEAVVVCHSMGCASAAAMAVNHPEKIKGLVFVAPATHPWPGGVTWYYNVAALPVIGNIFSELLALPFGQLALNAGVEGVFSPNEAPDNYAVTTAAELVLRPQEFRANARDVAGLKAEVTALQPRYKEIKKPTVVITGNKDDVVWPEIHSIGLERDIAGAELIILDGVGHKPDYARTDVVIDAIKKVAR